MLSMMFLETFERIEAQTHRRLAAHAAARAGARAGARASVRAAAAARTATADAGAEEAERERERTEKGDRIAREKRQAESDGVRMI